jgi:hypothetical protein
MTTAYVAHDIEKTGSFLIQNPVISVGFYIGDENGNELEKKRFNMEVNWPETDDYKDFEPRCWNEFWLKQDKSIIDDCKIDAKDQKTSWNELKIFIDSLEEKYTKIKFLTDNASFDTASIDYNLEKYTDRVPMRYSTNGKYRGVISADDMLDMLPEDRFNEAMTNIKNNAKHDHNPVNDAKFIYLMYIEAMKYKNNNI